ncbi:immunity 50 family protein [Streptomyces sp. NBC_01261]|uniref:Imm50 family immunity protein n=1 Tax=Streptomyces sp. NBC_01261 TaxID=2903802 RepID=UPI002E372E9A|nr:Imm50 family immunity protein [Streptomyces sp. NBC_01261]
MSADWLQLLTLPESCDLFYLHIDERENSATLGFDTRSLPSNPPAEWEGKGFNAFEYYLVFVDVAGLRVTGWGPAEAREVDLTAQEDGSVKVVLGTETSGVRFQASAVRLTKTRGYRASDTP